MNSSIAYNIIFIVFVKIKYRILVPNKVYNTRKQYLISFNVLFRVAKSHRKSIVLYAIFNKDTRKICFQTIECNIYNNIIICQHEIICYLLF